MCNLLVIVVTVNVFVIFLVAVAGFVLGYLIRSSLVRKCRDKISDLEREMLRDNARILELEKEKADLLKSYSNR